MNNESSIFRLFRLIISFVLAVAFLLPVIWMIFVALKPVNFIAEPVVKWFGPPYTLATFSDLIEKVQIFRWMGNSTIVALITTLIYIVLASLAAFAISTINFRYKKFIYVFFLAGLMIPTEATIISMYIIVRNINILDTYAALILPALAGPMGVVILKTFFDSIPRELVESAKIDGCSLYRLYFSIFLPLARPAIASVAIFTFIGTWNNFLWPMLATMSESMYTLPVGVPLLRRANVSGDYILPMAGNAMASLPVIIAFLIFEKQIVKGVTLTGIKA